MSLIDPTMYRPLSEFGSTRMEAPKPKVGHGIVSLKAYGLAVNETRASLKREKFNTACGPRLPIRKLARRSRNHCCRKRSSTLEPPCQLVNS